uniref:Uncharacterized protein n=1 Tax=Gossypium raimondii TaxID=29730 RepID=A0A0D2SAG0_GOSRA|nr:hypothetical protein B456_005G034700 [Gossypium raimondii]
MFIYFHFAILTPGKKSLLSFFLLFSTFLLPLITLLLILEFFWLSPALLTFHYGRFIIGGDFVTDTPSVN